MSVAISSISFFSSLNILIKSFIVSFSSLSDNKLLNELSISFFFSLTVPLFISSNFFISIVNLFMICSLLDVSLIFSSILLFSLSKIEYSSFFNLSIKKTSLAKSLSIFFTSLLISVSSLLFNFNSSLKISSAKYARTSIPIICPVSSKIKCSRLYFPKSAFCVH